MGFARSRFCLQRRCLVYVAAMLWCASAVYAEDTRLLRQPTVSQAHIAFTYGSDLWMVLRDGGKATRLTSTAAVEHDPHFSPDGKWIAFTSNRSGTDAVYVVAAEGGTPKRLTWYPASSTTRGWTPDGKRVLYSSSRETAPVGFDRLWTVALDGGPSDCLPAPWGFDGSFSPSGKRIIVDRVTRWDTEWRHYRGGQNTALTILNIDTLDEVRIPNERTTDIQPLWLGDTIYFLSDRDWTMNIWSYDTASKTLTKLTDFTGSDVKALSGLEDTLVFQRDGYLHTLSLADKSVNRLRIEAVGDFPWAETRWEDISQSVASASLSATGKRALFEARGEVFTVPVENGSTRNLTRSSGSADRMPTWSPKGEEIAWFSDDGSGYKLQIANQDGSGDIRKLDIGESKMAWESTWSPDGSQIAFVDNDLRVRVVDLEAGDIKTVDTGGINLERGSMGLTWSPDSKWLAYAKTFPNSLRRIVACCVAGGDTYPLTDTMADASSPSWDRDGKHLYFLASTDVALASGWANTSQMTADPKYSAYVILLSKELESPFAPESDEEEREEKEEDDDAADPKEESGKKAATEEKANDGANKEGTKPKEQADAGDAAESQEDSKRQKKKQRADRRKKKSKQGDTDKDTTESDETSAATKDSEATAKDPEAAPDPEDSQEAKQGKDVSDKKDTSDETGVRIDHKNLVRRILSLPLPVGDYRFTMAGPEGSVFIAESPAGAGGLTLHKFTLKDQKTTEYLKGFGRASVSSDGKKLLYRSGSSWLVADTSGPTGKGKPLSVSLQMRLDRNAEWQQVFDEAWRYMRDFFYDPDMHGRDWDIVRERYAPLVPYIRHRADLTYVLDQMSGEMSVGHSFVFGGDSPDIDRRSRVGVLGADLVAENEHWKISRIFTFENWNPGLRAPLDRPGLKVEEGNYILEINGIPLTAKDDPYQLLDGTAGQQTLLRLGEQPSHEDSWTVTVEPQRSEGSLRQRGWVEDNRRRVDELSDGKLAYVWVPNTGQPGVISFNRYYFSQQDKLGAVIDERYNGGGLLDDYMVDLMTRKLRAAVTNEVPGGRPFRLPAGIIGPKVLLINERAGSGGDFFPWIFRQQEAGPLIGTRTWGGLVKSSVHYSFVDGGAMTAPDNAVFDPVNKRWIGENEGIAPDIEVFMDAKSVAKGGDPQLQRGVKELLKQLEANPPIEVVVPEYPTPALQK